MKERKILKNKAYLYLTEFFSGMALMAVEIGAQRLISPYFSSSQIVWTIIIGTIMIAMALGNVYGGRSADKDPDPDKLYRRILIAAIWLALIPVVGKYVIIGISALLIFKVSHGFLIIAAFVVCMVVFVFPLFLLGTVTPSLAKYTMGSLEDNGKIVGTLGAANTIGSIIGTFMPTFVTIPAVGTNITFLIFSGILIALSVIYFISIGFSQHKKKIIASCLIFALCIVFGHQTDFAFWESKEGVKYEGESIYNYLRVKDDGQQVALSTNVLFGVQSIYNKKKSLTGMYYDYAMAAPLMTRDAAKRQDVLILGMGSGTFAHQCREYLPNVRCEGVEIDQKITDLARKYFDEPKSTKVVTYDGRAYLNAIDKKYDVIMVDAYQDITIPFQMSSVEFFKMVKSHLNDGGVMVVNMNMRGQSKGSITDYLTDTIKTVFPAVYTADVEGTTNRELFASTDTGIRENLETNLSISSENDDFRQMMSTVSGDLVKQDGGKYILTDDKAPVELLGIRVIDRLINEEVAYYRDIYNKRGIRAVMQELGI
ncbi:MAG: spermidine synthase [Lachnospiraceae bacterium]|uniref:Spermidine synthase n=1 Tax=Candidatus Weimeria bifida TaxID=2599074 RepID=A0A6N7J2K3_9FIRM|nr:spermidine synthase [Candidatus Weimeria bifida]RRF97360.1 MAG: spermidine synthase [Lachnospiraceae bacterium]